MSPQAPIPNEGQNLANPQAHEAQHRLWSRRQFLWSAGLAAVGSGMSLGGSTVSALPHSPLLAALQQADNERILVIINLSGGNDGLNTVVPRGNDVYYNSRPPLAKQEDDLFALTDDFGMPNTMVPIAPLCWAYQNHRLGQRGRGSQCGLSKPKHVAFSFFRYLGNRERRECRVAHWLDRTFFGKYLPSLHHCPSRKSSRIANRCAIQYPFRWTKHQLWLVYHQSCPILPNCAHRTIA